MGFMHLLQSVLVIFLVIASGSPAATVDDSVVDVVISGMSLLALCPNNIFF